MGFGIVIRDFHGEVMACSDTPQSFHSYPLVVEFRALWKAMNLYVELGFDHVQFEGDSQVLVNAINKADVCET